MSPAELIGPAELIAHAVTHIEKVMATPAGVIAIVAAATAAVLIVVSSFVKTMVPLRWLAVGSNAGFVVYGALSPSFLTLLLEGILLPINIYRALEMRRLTRRVTAAAANDDLSGIWLKPYMKTKSLKSGEMLFLKGDEADRLYFLADGQIEFVEIGSKVDHGTVFGEIAFFSSGRRRTMSARCVDDCTVLSIDDSTVRQLFFQNPAFGFQMMRLVASRLSADVQRLEASLAQARQTPVPAEAGFDTSRAR